MITTIHTYKIIEELIVGLSSGNKELPKDFSYLLTEIDEDRCKMNDEDITIICDDLSYKGSSVLTELKKVHESSDDNITYKLLDKRKECPEFDMPKFFHINDIIHNIANKIYGKRKTVTSDMRFERFGESLNLLTDDVKYVSEEDKKDAECISSTIVYLLEHGQKFEGTTIPEYVRDGINILANQECTKYFDIILNITCHALSRKNLCDCTCFHKTGGNFEIESILIYIFDNILKDYSRIKKFSEYYRIRKNITEFCKLLSKGIR